MKRVPCLLAITVAVAVAFSAPLFAAEPLTKDLYISEISISTNLDDKFVEIFVNNQVLTGDYFIMTTANDGASISTGYKLDGISAQTAGSYYVFTGVKTGLGLTNPSGGRIIYLCQGDQSKAAVKEACKADYIDKFAYGYLLNTDHSWARDFDDEELAFREAIKTPGVVNSFTISQEDDDDGTDDGVDQVPQYCSVLALSEVSSAEQWVEVYNKSDLTILPVNMSKCLLGVQSGDTKSGGTRKYSYYKVTNFLDGTAIGKYEYATLDLTKTDPKTKILPNSSSIKDRSVIMADDETDYEYGAIYKSQKDGTSLAYFGDGWKVTFAPTPGSENVYQQWQNCEAGKHINEATGNCVKDPDPPAECAEGQFRNPATGRCKKIAESTLVECAVGQFRNPATNRCKKIASDDGPTPCAEGYERNPDTNRCRKIVAGTDARFGVGPTNPDEDNNIWVWAGAGGAALVAGLIGWQFHPEIGRGVRRVTDFIKRPRGGV